jgi:hypothetical protein
VEGTEEGTVEAMEVGEAMVVGADTEGAGVVTEEEGVVGEGTEEAGVDTMAKYVTSCRR